jgi:nitroreductase
MSDLISEIKERRAFRALDERQVPRDVQKRILDAAVLAPSCANKQPWRFVVVDEGAALEAVRANLSGGNYWALKAPMYVLAVSGDNFDCDLEDRRHYALFDTGMAVMNLQLQAVREGLTVHPIAGFNDTGLKAALGIPSSHVLITVVVIAYPGSAEGLSEKHLALESSARERKAVEEVMSRNGWHFDE